MGTLDARPLSGCSSRHVNAHVTTAENPLLLRGCNYHRIYPLKAIFYTLALTFSEHAGCLSCTSCAQSIQGAFQQFLHVSKANFFTRFPKGNPLHLPMPALGSRHSSNVNLTFSLYNNQARFENQPTIYNLSKLTPCIIRNSHSPRHPQAALSFVFSYAFLGQGN